MTKEEMMHSLTETVAHPEFDNLVREIDEQPADERLNYAKEHATVEEMKNRGIPLVDGFRICIRMFEDTEAPSTDFDKIQMIGGGPQIGKWTVCASLGYFFCVSVGYTTD